MCALVLGKGGLALKTDEYVKIYDKENQQSNPKVAFLFGLRECFETRRGG